MKLHKTPTINGKEAVYKVDDFDLETYEDIIKIRELPQYDVVGRSIHFPASYTDEYTFEYMEMPLPITEELFDYEKVIAQVGWIKERYAIFATPGLGKTLMLGELARQYHEGYDDRIVLCVPLNIMRQFEDMLKDFFDNFPPFDHLHGSGMTLKEWCHYGDTRIAFVNHEFFLKKQDLKNVGFFGLDESSVLKGGAGGNGKIARNIIRGVRNVRYRYAASGTPAPNDRTEYAMHALFLGIVNSEKEFFQQYFTIQNDEYVLKRNAIKPFYHHLASWSSFIRDPKAYGFDDNLRDLKPWEEIYQQVELTPEQEKTVARWSLKGKQTMLAGMPIKPRGMTERNKFSQVSKGFYYYNQGKTRKTAYVESNKPKAIREVVMKHRPEQVLIWVVYDAEGDILKEELEQQGLKVAHITGSTKEEDRLDQIEQFRAGKIDIMISKPRILGFGLNFQFCRIAIFSGLDDSYEKYFQAVKRIHRYGQTKQVLIYHIYTAYEYVILANVLGKQKQNEQDFAYQEMLYRESLVDELKYFIEMEDYRPMDVEQTIKYEPIVTSKFELYHGDSLHRLTDIAKNGTSYGSLTKNSVDFSVFSPPFMGDLFVYTDSPADMGNTRGQGASGGLDEFMLQFQFFLRGMLAVTKPGRLMAIHLEDVPLRKGLDGVMGLYDFVGESIRQANEAGWTLLAKIPILKNQQAQSIIKRIASLSMSNMETDRLRIAPCSNGYLVLFMKQGEANIKVADIAKCHDCTWQGYAKELIGWQPDRGYKSDWLMEAKVFCPICDSANVEQYSEMNGNKWIMAAEGVWPDLGFEDYEKLSKEAQAKRWNDWVWTALGMWPDINETDVLYRGNKEQENSDKHLCPLPYTIARRAIEMYTLPGEVVFTPFAGSGTEVDQAIRLHRKAIGIELKPEYFMMSVQQAEKAVKESQQMTLFDLEALKE